MITITHNAANHILRYIERRGHGIGVRLGVKTTGCSGLAYIFEYVDMPLETDEVFLDKGITLCVDRKNLPYVAGTEIDYVKEGFSSGFKFSNPNLRDSCGCGESFRV